MPEKPPGRPRFTTRSVRFWNKYRFGEPTAQRNLLAQLATLRHLFLQLREIFEE